MNKRYKIGIDGSIKNYFLAESVKAFSLYYDISFDLEAKDIDFVFCVNEIRKPNVNPNVPIIAWIGERPTWLYLWKEFGYRMADIIFLTEKEFLDPVKQIVGHNNVYFLPLATSCTCRGRLKGEWQERISFIGNTMQKQIADIENEHIRILRLPLRRDEFFNIRLAVDEMNFNDFSFIMDDFICKSDVIKNYVEKFEKYSLFRQDAFMGYLGMCLTSVRRKQIIDNVIRKYPDMLLAPSDWAILVKANNVINEITYNNVGMSYNNCMINLNISSMHMPTSLNSRVFDVPANGGFLITDYRKGIEELFDKEELVTYHSLQELVEYINYYEMHDLDRMRITMKAQERVQKQHQYVHRVKYMMKIIRNNIL